MSDEEFSASADLTTKEQIEAMLNECYTKYPDAVEWMISQYVKAGGRLPKSKYEQFLETLRGNPEFETVHYNPVSNNLIDCIKAYRKVHDASLRQAKDRVEWYIANTYWDQLSDRLRQHYQRHRD